MPRFSRFLIRGQAPGVVVGMLAGIPTPACGIDPSAESETSIDNHQFLMMTGTDRMEAIELDPQSIADHPTDDREYHPTTEQDLDRAEIPFDYVNTQSFVALQQADDEATKGLSIRSTLQAYARIEIPTNKDNLTLRALQSTFKICKVLLTIYNNRCMVGAGNTFTIISGREQYSRALRRKVHISAPVSSRNRSVSSMSVQQFDVMRSLKGTPIADCKRIDLRPVSRG